MPWECVFAWGSRRKRGRSAVNSPMPIRNCRATRACCCGWNAGRHSATFRWSMAGWRCSGNSQDRPCRRGLSAARDGMNCKASSQSNDRMSDHPREALHVPEVANPARSQRRRTGARSSPWSTTIPEALRPDRPSSDLFHYKRPPEASYRLKRPSLLCQLRFRKRKEALAFFVRKLIGRNRGFLGAIVKLVLVKLEFFKNVDAFFRIVFCQIRPLVDDDPTCTLDLPVFDLQVTLFPGIYFQNGPAGLGAYPPRRPRIRCFRSLLAEWYVCSFDCGYSALAVFACLPCRRFFCRHFLGYFPGSRLGGLLCSLCACRPLRLFYSYLPSRLLHAFCLRP